MVGVHPRRSPVKAITYAFYCIGLVAKYAINAPQTRDVWIAFDDGPHPLCRRGFSRPSPVTKTLAADVNRSTRATARDEPVAHHVTYDRLARFLSTVPHYTKVVFVAAPIPPTTISLIISGER
jgi:hypothetical protein